ncbi:hypothetical protein JTE90_020181 [Oedothorax gibbosus]|uniref:BTB domain-containing protein n=1 Tax=Oedothorax gibbosus TaxID=931172 RepID=A0AAV6U2F0_9ARAC|nr:hypothetical protein JTE90_020181 [Oedothorax gibbosus]
MSQQLIPPSFCSFGDVLYLNEELRDISVIVEKDLEIWKFPAHKLVLAAESHFLRAKLQDETVNEIKLEDITPTTAELLLKFIYKGELEVENWNEGVDLLQAAFKLEIQNLVQKCGRFLEDVISLLNVCYVYDAASTCSLPVLRDKCLKLILDAGFLVLRSSAFEVLNKDCVMDIVTSSELNIDSELVVFETLFRWARIECCRMGIETTEANILTEIKPFLQHVCIDDMSDADKGALPPAILSCVKPNNRYRIGFSVLDSLLLYSKSLDLYCNRSSIDFVGESQSCLRFSIDSPLVLLGLSFLITVNDVPMDLPLILVKENKPKVNLFSHNLGSDPMVSSQVNQRVWHEIKVVLKQPIFLKPGDIYYLYVMDASNDVQLPQTTMLKNTLQTSTGYVNLTNHGINSTWGVTNLKVI